MKRNIVLGTLAAVVLIAFTLSILPRIVTSQEGMAGMAMPFGGKEEVKFAKDAWKAMGDYSKWPIKSRVTPGKTPHGAFIRMYYSMVSVDGKPYHVIVKDNFMGKDAEGNELNPRAITRSGKKHLAAVTVMVQREAGYDSDNNDWFWVKYNPDGSIAQNDKKMSLAGRVAKGMDMGCIACHKGAKDNDYLFFNDGEM